MSEQSGYAVSGGGSGAQVHYERTVRGRATSKAPTPPPTAARGSEMAGRRMRRVCTGTLVHYGQTVRPRLRRRQPLAVVLRFRSRALGLDIQLFEERSQAVDALQQVAVQPFHV